LISQGIPPLGGVKREWDCENKLSQAKCVNIPKTVR